MGESLIGAFQVAERLVDDVAVLEMSGARGNALDAAAFASLEDAVRATHREDVRAVVLTGTGSTFCVGADLSSGGRSLERLIDEDNGRADGWLEPAGRVTAMLLSSPIPVVAAINGDAVGGGATLSLAADVRVATPEARIGFGFGRVGVVPEGGSTWLLPRLVGMARAIDWMVSGRLVGAIEASAAGLITEIVERDLVLEHAIALARRLGASTSPRARRETLRLLWEGSTRGFDDSRMDESITMRELASSPDAREGMDAFVAGRRPRFRHALS